MLVALIQAILTKTKQNQKEARNDDQLKPNLITFLGLFVCMFLFICKVFHRLNLDREGSKGG